MDLTPALFCILLCGVVTVSAQQVCPPLDCLEQAKRDCPAGVVITNGCETCFCDPEDPFCIRATCPVGTRCDDTLRACVTFSCPAVCEIFCQYGNVLDADGCPICACRGNPCETVRCGFNTVCVTRVIDVVCVRAPCPPQVITECVDPTPRTGECAAALIPPCGANRDQCTYDAECDSPTSKCCQDACGARVCAAADSTTACGTLNCLVPCDYGVLYNDVGCPTCDCYEPCEGITCGPTEQCEGLSPPCAAGSSPQTCRPVGVCRRQCAEVTCALACGDLGFQTDEYGCPVCQCRCADVACGNLCRHGYSQDMYGCATCDCYDPCQNLGCGGQGLVCLVQQPTCTGCPPIASCVASAVKPGTCPRPSLSGWRCLDGRGDRCLDDGACPQEEKCCVTLCGRRCTQPLSAEGSCPMTLVGATSLYEEYARLAQWSPALPPITHQCTYSTDCRSDRKCCDSFTGRRCSRPLAPGRVSRDGTVFFRFLMRLFAGVLNF